MQHFRPWAEKELRVGNLYMRSVKSYHEVIADNDEENTVNYTYRVNLLMGGFFLISLCLGVFPVPFGCRHATVGRKWVS